MEHQPDLSDPRTPEAASSEERLPAYERAGRVRRFARNVLRTVMAETAAEAQRPHALNTEPLAHAAEDLQQADHELGETMHQFNAERLGVVAVLTAGHRYLARRRVGQSPDVQRHMNAQRAAFRNLRHQNAAGMAPGERAAYYDQLEQFTHRQAEVTRETTQELQQSVAAERPRYTWRQERAPEPLITVESADSPERLPGQAAADQPQAAAAPVVAPPTPPVIPPEPPKKPPLNPSALKREAARKARTAQALRKVWLYGAAAAAVVVAVILFIRLS